MIVYIPVGLPGCGKSTYFKQLKNDNSNLVKLSSDAYIEYQGSLLGLSYKDAFPLLIDDATKHYNEQLENSIKNRQDIYIDRTNLSKKSRIKLINKLPKDATIIGIYFDINDEIIDKQNKSRGEGRCINQEIIDNMKKYASKPTIDEGFTEIIVVKR